MPEEKKPKQLSFLDENLNVKQEFVQVPELKDLMVVAGNLSEGRAIYGLGKTRLEVSIKGEKDSDKFEIREDEKTLVSATLRHSTKKSLQLEGKNLGKEFSDNPSKSAELWLTVNGKPRDEEKKKIMQKIFQDVAAQTGKVYQYAEFEEETAHGDPRTDFLVSMGFTEKNRVRGRRDLGSDDRVTLTKKF